MGCGFNAGGGFQVAIPVEENGRKFCEEGRKNIECAEIRELFAALAFRRSRKRKFKTLRAQLSLNRRLARCGTWKTR